MQKLIDGVNKHMDKIILILFVPVVMLNYLNYISEWALVFFALFGCTIGSCVECLMHHNRLINKLVLERFLMFISIVSFFVVSMNILKYIIR